MKFIYVYVFLLLYLLGIMLFFLLLDARAYNVNRIYVAFVSTQKTLLSVGQDIIVNIVKSFWF